MHGFLDWFEDHKYSIIATLTVHSFLLFLFSLSTLSTVPEKATMAEAYVEVIPPAEVEQFIQRIEHPELAENMQVTNATSNITAQTSMSRASQARMAEAVESDLKAMEQAEFDRLAQERRDAGQEIVIPELDPAKWKKERYMKPSSEPIKVEGTALVSIDLDKRDRMPGIPGYLCRGSGRIVIKVEVERSGRVRKAEFDPERSQNVDECMFEHAMRSARETRFTQSSSAPEPQVGTITFTYVAQ